MDLDLSDDQELFLDTTRKFLAANWPTAAVRGLIGDPDGFDRTVWSRAVDLGWTSFLVPEAHGGGSLSGEEVSDMAIVAEEVGRCAFAGPVLSSATVAYALGHWASDEIASAHLANLAAGTEIAAWAVPEAGDLWGRDARGVTAAPEGDYYVITGSKIPVQDAHVADQILVSALAPQGLTLLLVPADLPGILIRPLEGLDVARRFSSVAFQGARVPAGCLVGSPGAAAPAIERQLALAVALQCAETVGATDRLYEMTLQYVKDRKAFGRPIGSYQALKHRLVDMLLWLESAKAVTVAAIKAVQHDVAASEAASLAKAYVGDRCPVIGRECLQMHGGIGYTWEHDLHLFMRRIEANASLYGNPDYHRDRLAPGVGFKALEEQN